MSKDLLLSKTVLLVDDFNMMREMIGNFLESLGMKLLRASNAERAIHSARSHQGEIDLLLTDIEMPGMSGFELANKIADLKPSIRVLYMSTGISLEDWNDYKEISVGTHFIHKPFRLEELRASLIAIFSDRTADRHRR